MRRAERPGPGKEIALTDDAVQPKIDFCEACGTPNGVEAVSASAPMPETPTGGPLTVKLNADISDFEAKVDALKVKLEALYEVWEKLNGATPAPLVEVPASPPPPIDDFDIEPDEDVLDIEPDEDVLTLEPSVPAPAPVPAPKTLTPDEVEGAIIAGIAKLDIRAEIEKSVSLTLDRLRGRVR
jgi:hypothetical protein